MWEILLKFLEQNGTVHGVLLGMDKYLPKYKQGDEALIVNISSIAGTEGFGHIPVYTATKHATLGLVKSWGIPEFYEETKVRIIALCPGVTMTPLISEMAGRNWGGKYERYLHNKFENWPIQQ